MFTDRPRYTKPGPVFGTSSTPNYVLDPSGQYVPDPNYLRQIQQQEAKLGVDTAIAESPEKWLEWTRTPDAEITPMNALQWGVGQFGKTLENTKLPFGMLEQLGQTLQSGVVGRSTPTDVALASLELADFTPAGLATGPARQAVKASGKNILRQLPKGQTEKVTHFSHLEDLDRIEASMAGTNPRIRGAESVRLEQGAEPMSHFYTPGTVPEAQLGPHGYRTTVNRVLDLKSGAGRRLSQRARENVQARHNAAAAGKGYAPQRAQAGEIATETEKLALEAGYHGTKRDDVVKSFIGQDVEQRTRVAVPNPTPARVADYAQRNPEGFTIDPITGEVPLTGLAGAQRGTEARLPNASLEDIERRLVEQPPAPGQYLGGWKNKGEMVLDTTEVMNRNQFPRLRGNLNWQNALFDLDRMREIPLGLRNYFEAPPMRPGSIASQRGSMPLGGPVQLGMLGLRKPHAPRTMDEMLEEANYTLGSAPGVYTHGEIPTQRARGTLDEYERELLGDLPPDVRKQAADDIREYRSTHHPGLGWAPVKPLSVGVNAKGQPEINWQMQAPQFHIDPSTGKPYAGQARSLRVEDVSNEMVAEVEDLISRAGQGDTNAQFIVDQARWYKDAERTIKDLFGVQGPLYADVQGSLSPNTRLSQQHKMAQEVFERFNRGELDDTLARFDAHMAKKPADISDSKWANLLRDKKSEHYDPDAIIRKESGKLYGMNSINAMMALRGLLRQLEPGMAPKMRNFAGNLGGTSVDPTVDVWAGRTVQRLSGLPRIPPATDAGVPGVIAQPSEMLSGAQRKAMNTAAITGKESKALEKARQAVPKPDITAQYGLASDVFKTAAAKLGIDADDLQALMWFREKELWESQGWTPIDQQPSLVEHIVRDNPR